MNLPLSDVQMSIQSKTKLFADPEDEQRSHRIRKTILEAGNQLRERHPWLVQHQDQNWPSHPCNSCNRDYFQYNTIHSWENALVCGNSAFCILDVALT